MLSTECEQLSRHLGHADGAFLGFSVTMYDNVICIFVHTCSELRLLIPCIGVSLTGRRQRRLATHAKLEDHASACRTFCKLFVRSLFGQL